MATEVKEKKTLKIFSSQITPQIALLFCRNVHLIQVYRIPVKNMIRQKTWLLCETRIPFIKVSSKMNVQSLWTSPRETTFGKLLKSQNELLPFGALCYLIGKMHNASKFWTIKFVDADFVIMYLLYIIYDIFVQRQRRACVRRLFLEKTSPQKLLTGFLPNFSGMFLR